MEDHKIKFKDNTEEVLQFDPIPHKYYWNNTELPSATTITKILVNASIIGNWTAKMCTDEFLKLVKAGKSYDEIQIIEIADKIKKSASVNMSQAGNVGSQVHDIIENYIHTGMIPEIHNDLMKKSFEKFKEWYDAQQGLELVFTETKVLSRVHKFTGTLDALFKKGNEYIIYDWKTSSGIRDSYYVQLYLYVIALEEMMDIKINKGVIVNATKTGKLNIAEFNINSNNQDIAISCLKMYRFLNNKKE
jgi:hypothetical protein